MGKLKIFPRTSNPRLSISMNMPDDIATWMLMNKKEYTEKMKLFQIIREGSLGELVSLMNTLKDAQSILNVKDDTGISPLHITSRFNKPEAAEILLQHGADPNISASRGSPLTVACRFKHEDVVKVLIKYGADPLLDVSSEGNVLHSIAISSTVSIAEIVFKSVKPPVNSRSKLGRTPLHCAAHSGNEEICLWLLCHGADPKAKCNRMSTPLMIASKHGHVNIIRSLIMSDKCSLNSADHMLNEVDDEGNGPLHYAVLDNKTEAVHELLQLGCCPNLLNNHSMTPLHFCASDGDVNLVTLLSSYLANLELNDLKGQTPLHKASEHNRLGVVEVLLQLGADIDTQDNKMYTPLMIACHKGYVELVKLLLKHGAETSKKNNLSQTCLQVATIRSQYDVVQVLLSLGDKALLYGLDLFDQSALHQAAKLKDVKFINLLLEKGCSPTAFDALQETPLHIAAKNGSFETVKRLAEACSDLNCENYESKSPFFIACEVGNRKAMRALIQAGANVKDTDMHLRNTLAVAAMNGYSDIVQDLIEMGVSLNCRDEEKNTALHHACSNGHVDTVKVLLDANASVTTTNLNGLSPLGMAVMQHKTDVVLAMIDHSSWEESLSVRDKTGATCLDRMIANTPEGVKAVLDKCVRRSNHDPSHEDYK
ncbi:26S proteasome non-ATPase regulatory subunit 10, partial [Biomphalaria glabrata]